MQFPKNKRFEDKAYRQSFQGQPCIVKGCMDRHTVIGAHVNEESYSGWARKTHDFHTLPLCYLHHLEQSKDRGFWLRVTGARDMDEVKKIAEKRYEAWKCGI